MIVTLLISIGIISLISVFLAILLVIADATIGNYGVVKKISINDGSKELEVQGGQPLLKALNQEGVFIPSACGGRGSCGLCKVRVVDGGGEYLPTELPWISDEERQNNVRLSCQFKVKQDVAIVIPEELFLVKQFTTVVESIRDLTHDIKEVRLLLKDPAEITPKAGQYVQFEVPEYDLTDERVYRAYSMASSPDDKKNHVELEIRLVPNGICTTYVHKHLKEGDEIIINGPYGDFFSSAIPTRTSSSLQEAQEWLRLNRCYLIWRERVSHERPHISLEHARSATCSCSMKCVHWKKRCRISPSSLHLVNPKKKIIGKEKLALSPMWYGEW